MADKSKIERFIDRCDYSATGYAWWVRGDENKLPYCTCVPSSPSAAEIENVELRDLLRAARNHIDLIHSAFGAPGDWGYDEPKGQALFDAYKWAMQISAKVDGREHNEMPEVRP